MVTQQQPQLQIKQSEELSSIELFKKMAMNDRRQNQRLTNNKLGRGKSLTISSRTKDPATKIRFLVCSLGLISMAMSQMSRMVLNLCITSMVDSSMINKKVEVSLDDSCPWPEDKVTDEGTVTTTEAFIEMITTLAPASEYLMNQANNTSGDYSGIQPETTTIAPDIITSDPNRFPWTMRQQSILLGGFYYSYFFFMVLGGRMAEVYGAKYVLLISVGGSALVNLVTPFLARNSFVMLVCSRVLLGTFQSGVFPALYALIAKWLTMSEASIFAPLIRTNLRLGMLLGSLVPGLMPGWPHVFYFTGCLNAIWCIVWWLVATSRPEDNSWVNEAELERITKKKGTAKVAATNLGAKGKEMTIKNGIESQRADQPQAKRSLKTPWLKIITSSSVIGLVLTKLSFNYCLDFMAILLPSYLSYVLHVPKATISFITTSMFAIQVLLIVFVGWLAKYMVLERPMNLSKTAIRKIFQSTSSYGIGIMLILLSLNECNLTYVFALLQILSFVTMFTAGGETMLPYDLSLEYPATIMAIANSVANMSGVTSTLLAAVILGEQGGSYSRWNILIYLIAGVNIIGGTLFNCLVKAEPIDFSESKGAKKDVESGQEFVEISLEKRDSSKVTKEDSH